MGSCGFNCCHNHAIFTANQVAAALIVMSPDTLWADGTFATVRQHAEAGKRAIMMHAPRSMRDDVLGKLPLRHAGEPMQLSNRLLVQLALDNLHPYSKSLFWNSDDYNRWPSQLYWRIGKRTMLARCFHLHPLMIYPRRKDRFLSRTIDSDSAREGCPVRRISWRVRPWMSSMQM